MQKIEPCIIIKDNGIGWEDLIQQVLIMREMNELSSSQGQHY